MPSWRRRITGAVRHRLKTSPPPGTSVVCRGLVELVTDYLDDALDSAAKARFQDHLSQCTGCTAYLEQLRTVRCAIGTLREEDLDPDFQDRLLQAMAANAVNGN